MRVVKAPTKRHLRTRDVPHPVRKFVQQDGNGRRAGAKRDDHEPSAPAISFLFADLNERTGRVPRKVFGQYPKTLIGNLLPWLGCERREILHVCSGSLPPGEGIRVDVRKEAHPDILADGRALPLADGSVAAVMLDPPYTAHYAKDLYGVPYPRPSHLLREAARVVRPGGRIAFVHYITPNQPRGCRVVKVFGLSVGFGYPMRAVTIFERGAGLLPGVARLTSEAIR